MFNNIKLLEKGFDRIYEIEKKVNYEYEPMYYSKIKGWKRNLFFKELKNDFIKDVTEFGFCPYIPKACDEQQKNKNISKFSKIDNYSKLNYIKSLYRQLNEEIDKEKLNLNLFNSKNKNKNIKRYSMTSMRIRKNKSSLNMETKNKKNFFLKKIANSTINVMGLGVGQKLKKNKNKNAKNNPSLVNICFKKDKSVNKSVNEFIEAESFVYEPEKIFFKRNQNYYRDNSFKEDTTNVPKSNTLINNISKKENIKSLEVTPPKNVNINAINYFKNLKGSFSTRNNNTIDKNILNKNNNYTLKKDKTVNRFLKKVRLSDKKLGDKEFRLLALSRKMKYG